MDHKIVLLMMLLYFVSMVSYVTATISISHNHTHAENGFYDDHMYHRMANGSTSDSEDSVLNGRNLLKEGHQFQLWMDVQVLLSFKKRIKDPSGRLSNWTTDNSEEACSWYGITCTQHTHTPRVVAIILPGLNLTGTISPSIGNLSLLHTLNISDNSLKGEIPPEIGQLKALRILDFSISVFSSFKGMLTGSLPESLFNCTSLQQIALERNNFTGTISTKIGRLVKLEQLNLYYNSLGGSIPPTLGNCTKLSTLSLGGNYFTGTIPTNFGSLVKLEFLDLHGNSLGGHIPSILGNCTKLSSLFLNFNYFTGTIPAEFGRLVKLEHLCLRSNLLGGPINPALGNCTKLGALLLDSNNFTGSIPTEFGRLVELRFLDLDSNSLGGQIPPILGNCPKLFLIHLNNNQFSGSIPGSVFDNLTALQTMDLSHNNLEGPMPALHKSGVLKKIDVSQNSFSGHLDIQLPVSLRVLSVFSNNFSGSLPSSLVNCSKLEILDVRKNRFTGQLFKYVIYLKELQVLNAGYNKFYGNIKGIVNLKKLHILDLSNNEFGGKIPLALEGLQAFSINVSQWTFDQMMNYVVLHDLVYTMEIDIKGREYNLSYELPTESIFDLSHNNFTGEIPVSIGSLRSLRLLNLSWNQLEGKIPASLGRISTLEELDLAKNNLSGEIPQTLSKSSMLGVVNFSSNNLCGQIPTGTQFSTFNVSSFERNKCLCGYPLQSCNKTRSNGDIGEKNKVEIGFFDHVNEKISFIALGIGVVIGFGGVVVVFIAWKKAREWVVPTNTLKPFYGVYRFPK